MARICDRWFKDLIGDELGRIYDIWFNRAGYVTDGSIGQDM
jgi:hypothetical protein